MRNMRADKREKHSHDRQPKRSSIFASIGESKYPFYETPTTPSHIRSCNIPPTFSHIHTLSHSLSHIDTHTLTPFFNRTPCFTLTHTHTYTYTHLFAHSHTNTYTHTLFYTPFHQRKSCIILGGGR